MYKYCSTIKQRGRRSGWIKWQGNYLSSKLTLGVIVQVKCSANGIYNEQAEALIDSLGNKKSTDCWVLLITTFVSQELVGKYLSIRRKLQSFMVSDLVHYLSSLSLHRMNQCHHGGKEIPHKLLLHLPHQLREHLDPPQSACDKVNTG